MNFLIIMSSIIMFGLLFCWNLEFIEINPIDVINEIEKKTFYKKNDFSHSCEQY